MSDLLIIGSGPGGYRAAYHAATHGLSVVIVEESKAGGTCLNSGCIPTKSLCRDAEIIETLRNAERFGASGVTYSVDFAKIVARKDDVVSRLRSGVESLLTRDGITFVRGHAMLVDSHSVVVEGRRYEAKNVIIATGSRPTLPPIAGIGLPGVMTSDALLELRYVPEELCIVGAGVVGMEMASAFCSFGSKVTVVEYAKEVLPSMDGDIAKRLRQALGRRGVTIQTQCAVASIAEESCGDTARTKLCVTYERKGRTAQTRADVVLIATGRKPNVDGLGIESLGIESDGRGITTDDDYQTTVPGVYAIGDVNGRQMLAHAATAQGLHVVNHILGAPCGIRHDVLPAAVFTIPEAASVGMSDDEACARGIEHTCRKGFFRSNGKAVAMGDTDGMIKIVVDARDRIIGCHAFGPHAADIVQETASLMSLNATMRQLAGAIHIHPTLGETVWETALAAL